MGAGLLGHRLHRALTGAMPSAPVVSTLTRECDDRSPPPLGTTDQGRNLPRETSLRAFDFDANASVDPAVIHTLATCEWVKKGRVTGPPVRTKARGRQWASAAR